MEGLLHNFLGEIRVRKCLSAIQEEGGYVWRKLIQAESFFLQEVPVFTHFLTPLTFFTNSFFVNLIILFPVKLWQMTR